MFGESATLTTLLSEWRKGNQDAGRQIMTAAYDELRRIAAQYFRQERPGHTLEATAVVHELSIRMLGSAPVDCQNTAHFLAIAARQMRRVLIDHSRRANAEKRAGPALRLSLGEVNDWPEQSSEDLIEVDEALQRLERLDARAARIVELRFFAGMTENEITEALGISVATLRRDWRFARAWLMNQLLPHGKRGAAEVSGPRKP
jgi:RNA polymerase sigma-70 factor (ECF subfamily)